MKLCDAEMWLALLGAVLHTAGVLNIAFPLVLPILSSRETCFMFACLRGPLLLLASEGSMKLDTWEMRRALDERDTAAILAIFARHSPELLRIPASGWRVLWPVGQRNPSLFAGNLFMRWTEKGIVRDQMHSEYNPALYLPPRLGG